MCFLPPNEDILSVFVLNIPFNCADTHSLAARITLECALRKRLAVFTQSALVQNFPLRMWPVIGVWKALTSGLRLATGRLAPGPSALELFH